MSPNWAFFEPLIPGLNLYSLPARAGEVISKLGGSMLGTSLIAISFFLIIGPPIVAGIYLRVFARLLSDPPREFWSTLGTTLLVSFTVQVVGLLIALYVLWHIEGMFRRRVAGDAAGSAAVRRVRRVRSTHRAHRTYLSDARGSKGMGLAHRRLGGWAKPSGWRPG